MPFVLAKPLYLVPLLEAAVGIEPTNKGFADLCLTTWLRRRKKGMKDEKIAHPSSLNFWSGKRGSNSRPQPWQGCALPTELFPHVAKYDFTN